MSPRGCRVAGGCPCSQRSETVPRDRTLIGRRRNKDRPPFEQCSPAMCSPRSHVRCGGERHRPGDRDDSRRCRLGRPRAGTRSSLASGFLAHAPCRPATSMARCGLLPGGPCRARQAAASRLRRRGAPSHPCPCRGCRRQGLPAPGRRLCRVVRRLLCRQHQGQAEGHLADGSRAHLRLGGPCREGGPYRRAVRQAPLLADRTRRLRSSFRSSGVT